MEMVKSGREEKGKNPARIGNWEEYEVDRMGEKGGRGAKRKWRGADKVKRRG